MTERLTKVDVEPHQGCACRWDADDNRVATCVRHQGWLDVVKEWADRAKDAESALAAEQAKVRDLAEALESVAAMSEEAGISRFARSAIAKYGEQK